VPQPLPRFYQDDERTRDAQKIKRIIEAIGEDVPPKVLRATAGGDARRLRGIPAHARGTSGAIAGHRPCARSTEESEPASAVEAPRAVRCGACGCAFELSARNVRAARTRREEPKCGECRGRRQVPTVTAAHRCWWLERFTLEEIRELAEAVFGGQPRRPD
jgi:hypothetical protein